MRRIVVVGVLTVVTVAVAGIVGRLWRYEVYEPPAASSKAAVTGLLGSTATEFPRVDTGRRFAFPDDHGAHPQYPTEWWYFTGNLATREGRHFGFQLTFLRIALSANAPQRASSWGTNQIYRGQFTLTDVEGKQFLAFEKVSRAGLGLSGANPAPVSVWVENWSVAVTDGDPDASAFHIQAAEGEGAIDLRLTGAKPPVQPGTDNMLGDTMGARRPFHFYLMTRLRAQGRIRLASGDFAVTGLAWLDRAWGEVPLSQGPVVLNRFVLQLDDRSDLLCFQLRRRDGTGTPINAGLRVGADGSAQTFGRKDIEIDVVETWRSHRDGARYPARWRFRIPSRDIDLDVRPVLADQEVELSVRYWSGAVAVAGEVSGRTLGGRGHVELTGYADDATG